MGEDKREPLVSVCMITYNHELYIRQAIEGVLMQKTSFPIELIISEDCGTDATRSIIQEYQKKHPDIIVADLPESNRGMMANSSHCLGLARGKYIALCEGDDYWIDPLKIQRQVAILEENENIGLCYTDNMQCEGNGEIHKPTKSVLGINSPIQFQQLLLTAGFMAPCSWLFRKDLLAYIPADTLRCVDGSYGFALEFLLHTHFHCIPEATAVYRIHSDSVTHTLCRHKKYQYLKGIFDIQKQYLHYLEDRALAEIFIKERSRFFIYTALKYRDYSYANTLIRFVMAKEFPGHSRILFPVYYCFVLLECLYNLLVWKNYKQKMGLA